MKASDLIVLNDQIVAAAVLMKGTLASDIAEAKAALAALGSAKEILAVKAANEADLAAFVEYKASVEVSFANEEAVLAADNTDYVNRVSALSVAKQALQINQGVLAAGQADLANKQDAYIRQAQADQAALVAARAEISSEKTALDTAFADVAKRELALSQKLAAMKALAV